MLPASVGPASSGFVGRLKRRDGYLLIPHGLLADSLIRTDEGSINLKDLLTAFARSLERLFEKRAYLEASFLASSAEFVGPFRFRQGA